MDAKAVATVTSGATLESTRIPDETLCSRRVDAVSQRGESIRFCCCVSSGSLTLSVEEATRCFDFVEKISHVLSIVGIICKWRRSARLAHGPSPSEKKEDRKHAHPLGSMMPVLCHMPFLIFVGLGYSTGSWAQVWS